MSEPTAGATEPDRCPSCGARVVPGQDWCTLCLQPLGTPAAGHGAPADGASEPPPPDPADPYAGLAPGHLPPADERATDDPVAGGSGSGGQGSSRTGSLPPEVAEAMLAELAATTAADRPLGRGPLSGTSRGMRTAIGCGAAIVLVGVVVALLSLLGLLL